MTGGWVGSPKAKADAVGGWVGSPKAKAAAVGGWVGSPKARADAVGGWVGSPKAKIGVEPSEGFSAPDNASAACQVLISLNF